MRFSDRFYEVFPYYLAIGMAPEQFWDQDCQLAKYYRKAYEIKTEIRNQEFWMQGMYFYEALCDAAPLYDSMSKRRRARPYSPEPYPLKSQDKRKPAEKTAEKLGKGDAKAKAMMEAFMVAHNKKFERKKSGDMNAGQR